MEFQVSGSHTTAFAFVEVHPNNQLCSVWWQSLLLFTPLTFLGYKVLETKFLLVFFEFPQYSANHMCEICVDGTKFLSWCVRFSLSSHMPNSGWIRVKFQFFKICRFREEEKKIYYFELKCPKVRIADFQHCSFFLIKTVSSGFLQNWDLLEFSGMPIFLKAHMKILRCKPTSLSCSHAAKIILSRWLSETNRKLKEALCSKQYWWISRTSSLDFQSFQWGTKDVSLWIGVVLISTYWTFRFIFVCF